MTFSFLFSGLAVSGITVFRSGVVAMGFVVAASMQPAAAQVLAPPNFASRAACEQADKISREQCGFAFTNARAEFEEKAPRFRARGDCVRIHKTCSAQIVGQAGFNAAAQGPAIYVPSFQGVVLVAAKGADTAFTALPRITAGAARFKPRGVDKLDDTVDGRVAVVPDSQARGSSGNTGRRSSNDPQSSAPYVKRGDRDDTIKGKLEVRNPNDPTATGLFVDKDGVEWYRPARRR